MHHMHSIMQHFSELRFKGGFPENMKNRSLSLSLASSARALAVGMVSATIWRVKPLFQPHAEVHRVLHRDHHLTTSVMSMVDPPRARGAHKCHHAHRDRQAALDQPLGLAAGSFCFCTPAWPRHVRIAV